MDHKEKKPDAESVRVSVLSIRVSPSARHAGRVNHV